MAAPRSGWSVGDTMDLLSSPFHDLLAEAQRVHRERVDPHLVEGAMLLSIKTGGCSEDCAYCPQSARWSTGLAPELPGVGAGLRAAPGGGLVRGPGCVAHPPARRGDLRRPRRRLVGRQALRPVQRPGHRRRGQGRRPGGRRTGHQRGGLHQGRLGGHVRNPRHAGLDLDDIADFSSEGPRRDGVRKPDVAAPGAMIVSAVSAHAPGRPENLVDALHTVNAGTSMAAPFVTGLVALLLERDPQLDPEGVKALLRDHSIIPGQPSGTFDPKWGYGLVDASGLADGDGDGDDGEDDGDGDASAGEP